MGEIAQAMWQIPLEKLPLSQFGRIVGEMPKYRILFQVMQNLW